MDKVKVCKRCGVEVSLVGMSLLHKIKNNYYTYCYYVPNPNFHGESWEAEYYSNSPKVLL